VAEPRPPGHLQEPPDQHGALARRAPPPRAAAGGALRPLSIRRAHDARGRAAAPPLSRHPCR